MCDVSEQAIEYATMNLRMNHVPVFGGVKVHEINGYYVFVAEKRILSKKDKDKTTNNLSKKLQRKQQRNKIHRKGA